VTITVSAPPPPLGALIPTGPRKQLSRATLTVATRSATHRTRPRPHSCQHF
jgi:hypothetical protein